MINLPSTTYKEKNDPPCLSQKYGQNFLEKNLASYGAQGNINADTKANFNADEPYCISSPFSIQN